MQGEKKRRFFPLTHLGTEAKREEVSLRGQRHNLGRYFQDFPRADGKMLHIWSGIVRVIR